MRLHAAASNAEWELKKSKPSSLNEVSQEMADAAPPLASPLAPADLAELKTALVAAVRSTAQKPPSKAITCWRCNRVGHMSYQCRAPPSFCGQPRGQGPSRS